MQAVSGIGYPVGVWGKSCVQEGREGESSYQSAVQHEFQAQIAAVRDGEWVHVACQDLSHSLCLSLSRARLSYESLPLPSCTTPVSVLQGNGRQGQLVIVPVSTSPA